jgi:hypothetical protein
LQFGDAGVSDSQQHGIGLTRVREQKSRYTIPESATMSRTRLSANAREAVLAIINAMTRG